MKKTLLIMIAVAAFCPAAFSQPKSVTDFYLAMPSNFYNFAQVKGKAALAKYRRKNIKTEDIKNGYIRIESTDMEGWGEVALFKKKDGSYIIGQTETGCGPVCGGGIDFWTYKAGKWAKVSQQVFPFSDADIQKIFDARKTEEEDRAYYFELPRQGRTIVAKCDGCDSSGDGVIASFGWDGAKFVKK